MTTLDPHVSSTPSAVVTGAGRAGEDGASTVVGSILGWITSTDHKRIGRMMSLSALAAGAVVTVLAALIGFDRSDNTTSLIDVGAVSQVFTAYRVGMVMLVVVPLLLGLALAVVPLQLGARAVAFARLALGGFWAWFAGSVMMIVAISTNGGPDGGKARFVSLYQSSHILALLGLFAVVICVATTVLTTRAPGMTLRRIPPFTWSVLVFCLGLLLIIPATIAMLVYTWIDFRHGRAAFGESTALGGWLGFAYSQPATIVYAIPALGFGLEALVTATRRRLPLRGVAFSGIGIVGIAALGAITRTRYGFERDAFTGSFGNFLKQAIPFVLFSVLPVVGAAVVLAVGLLAIVTKAPRIISPLVFGFLGVALVVMGMAASLVDLIGDARLGGTVFEEGAWILIIEGALLCALGGIVYWSPKFAGGGASDAKVVPMALLGTLGVFLAGAPLLIAGFAKQPANTMAFIYGGPHDLWNILSAIGQVLIALNVIAIFVLHFAEIRQGGHAGDDPWNAQTLEWATPSPAPDDNFAEVHSVISAEPLLDLKPQGDSQ